jgi:hypothetical protein
VGCAGSEGRNSGQTIAAGKSTGGISMAKKKGLPDWTALFKGK